MSIDTNKEMVQGELFDKPIELPKVTVPVHVPIKLESCDFGVTETSSNSKSVRKWRKLLMDLRLDPDNAEDYVELGLDPNEYSIHKALPDTSGKGTVHYSGSSIHYVRMYQRARLLEDYKEKDHERLIAARKERWTLDTPKKKADVVVAAGIMGLALAVFGSSLFDSDENTL